MDMTMVDVTGLEVEEGDEVEVLDAICRWKKWLLRERFPMRFWLPFRSVCAGYVQD